MKFIRLPQVKTKTGLSRSSIYAMMSQKTFPQNIKLGARAVAWNECEIDQWLTAKMEQSQ
ncbi:AlpA family transcriptional regulator [Thalassotalea atypica]|uniref:AlpA family transcriptional regulator n=1 Tax=Thalassotalea atypica TaxID=2054316 RepID=UPI002572A9BF|nr:AlpA family transcriptional regulator [Thalassotalea atypica]